VQLDPTPPSSSQLFVYGTLMAPQVMQTLVGRLPRSFPARLASPSSSILSNNSTTTATTNDDDTNNSSYYYSRHRVKAQVFPALVVTTTRMSNRSIDSPTTTNSASPSTTAISGILYQDFAANEWKILDWFEDQEYQRINVIVETTLSSSRKSTSDL
jgi:gamma-glutamylcyclotransferase (GGCT)/AIG2-like uncharacterized protein YtfP